MLKVFRIKGDSMMPTLKCGDYVVASNWIRRPKAGKLMVVDHPRYGVIIKRAVKKDGNGYWFASDSDHGVTTREIGALAPHQIMGRVLFAIRKKRNQALD